MAAGAGLIGSLHDPVPEDLGSSVVDIAPTTPPATPTTQSPTPSPTAGVEDDGVQSDQALPPTSDAPAPPEVVPAPLPVPWNGDDPDDLLDDNGGLDDGDDGGGDDSGGGDDGGDDDNGGGGDDGDD
ncbi:hypothetical protein [Arthrobacter sp. CAN_A1]|uniref:hypothetical protein n=1 Tax=Arthrobacter sp. CAN_A1 TaxID=2787717 RepID=UPI002FD78136